jgi:hypothetical protein
MPSSQVARPSHYRTISEAFVDQRCSLTHKDINMRINAAGLPRNAEAVRQKEFSVNILFAKEMMHMGVWRGPEGISCGRHLRKAVSAR